MREKVRKTAKLQAIADEKEKKHEKKIADEKEKKEKVRHENDVKEEEIKVKDEIIRQLKRQQNDKVGLLQTMVYLETITTVIDD